MECMLVSLVVSLQGKRRQSFPRVLDEMCPSGLGKYIFAMGEKASQESRLVELSVQVRR